MVVMVGKSVHLQDLILSVLTRNISFKLIELMFKQYIKRSKATIDARDILLQVNLVFVG